jgi:CheY-like chemotaxis protein
MQHSAAAASTPARILVVEDERIVAASLALLLQQDGYAIAGDVGTAEEALAVSAETKPDLVLMDIKLGDGMDGIEATRRIQESFQIPVIVLTGYSDPATLVRAGAVSPYGYLVKPLETRMLRPAIEMALYRHRAERERGRLLAEIDKLRSLLPVCAWCRKVKDDDGYWIELTEYLAAHLGASVSHGICADCRRSGKTGSPSGL